MVYRPQTGVATRNMLQMDAEADYMEDSPRRAEVPGDIMMTEGKFKGTTRQKGLTMQDIYMGEKNYVQWARSHITGTCGQIMRRLKLYIELRDQVKMQHLNNMENPPMVWTTPPSTDWSRVSTLVHANPKRRAQPEVMHTAYQTPQLPTWGISSILGRRSRRDDDMEIDNQEVVGKWKGMTEMMVLNQQVQTEALRGQMESMMEEETNRAVVARLMTRIAHVDTPHYRVEDLHNVFRQ